jgi:hypothetical protein
MMRPATSLELPGANGTTMETGRVGQSCAEAAFAAKTTAAARNAA